MLRGADPAVANASFLRLTPAAYNAFSSQVNDCIKAGNPFRRQGLAGVPTYLSFAGRRAAHQTSHLKPTGIQRWQESGANRARNAGDERSEERRVGKECRARGGQ